MFKVGDRVIRVQQHNEGLGIKIGDQGTVSLITRDGEMIELKEYPDAIFFKTFFKKVCQCKRKVS